MTPALLLAAMLGAAPVDTTRDYDGCNWTTCIGDACTVTLMYCPPAPAPVDSCPPYDPVTELNCFLHEGRAIRYPDVIYPEAKPDTIGYWLSRRMEGGWQPLCDVYFANGECADRNRPPPTPIVEVIDTVWVMRKR